MNCGTKSIQEFDILSKDFVYKNFIFRNNKILNQITEGNKHQCISNDIYKSSLNDESNLIFKKNKDYSGQFLNGIYHGYGTSYDDLGFIVYEGNWIKGVKSGFGITYEKGKKVHKGYYENNKFEGEGTQYYSDIDKIWYKGMFYSGQKSGVGTIFYENGEKFFSGELLENKFDGEGTMYYDNGAILYSGHWANDKLHKFNLRVSNF